VKLEEQVSLVRNRLELACEILLLALLKIAALLLGSVNQV